jgi:rhamnulokinase
MTTPLTLLAVDLGNESGRLMQIGYDGAGITAREAYRFPNHPVTVNGTLYWDVLRLWHEIQGSVDRHVADAAGIAIDSFGVDFGLLDQRGHLIANPVHMRDARTTGMIEWVTARVPREVLFQRTGIGFYVINTLYQLASLLRDAPYQLEAAHTLLTMPNLINYWLTGEALSEFTHSTTTQCYAPARRDWDYETLDAIGVQRRIFPPIVPPGQRIGAYRGVPVFTVASHDTGSAVVAVPTETPHYCYISSGTWSLFGVEVDAPVTTPAAMHANFTNEGGAGGKYRLLKMVMGLWILQQCRVVWGEQGLPTDYDSLFAQAAHAAPFAALFDPDDARFFAPGDMPARIRDFCRETGQPIPQSAGEVVRSLMESLALKYRVVLEELIAVTGQSIEAVHIVGGGAQNAMLCAMTANAVGRPVLAGPNEATALGNGLVQLIALGELGGLADARALIRRSLPPTRYDPVQGMGGVWDAAYERFRRLLIR